MKRVNVLITAASRRVPLVRSFRSAVEKFGRGRVVTTEPKQRPPVDPPDDWTLLTEVAGMDAQPPPA